MKKLAFFLFSLLVFFAGGFALSRFYPQVESLLAKAPAQEEKILDCGFSPAPYPIQNRPFAIAIIGRNNGAAVEKTLQSAFSQKYEEMRIIYIDDASSDGSFEHARDLIYDSGLLCQVTLVKNEEPLGHAANLFRAVQSCRDDEIVVVLNGEDRLAHEWVLQRLNQYYADPDLWLTYGQYRDYPSFQLGQSRPFSEAQWKEKGIRGIPFASFHLKTFYAALFKTIREEDLLYQGQFMPAAADLAYMIPLLEMAKDHFQFLPEILYLSTGAPKEERELQARCEQHIRSQTAYAPLSSLSLAPQPEIEALGTP